MKPPAELPFPSLVATGLGPAVELRLEPDVARAHIMMVDDELTTLEVLRIHLEAAGYTRFTLCDDSGQAMALIEQERPDILLLDLMMPDVTGFEILDQVRAHDGLRHLPVVILTSSVDGPTKLRALELGATDFLAKPVDPSELVLRLRNTLTAKAYQDRLTYFDLLTGLPNLLMFNDRLAWAIEHAARHRISGALMLIELTRLREINDTLGPGRADMLLQHIAQRLDQASQWRDLAAGIASNQMLARTGGAEYSLLLVGEFDTEFIERMVKHVLFLLNEAFIVDGHELYVSVNIGIARFPDDGDDADTIRQNASVAVRSLQEHQSSGFLAHRFYSRDLTSGHRERLNLESDLRRALERDEFELFYQPQFRIGDGRLIGTEALIRWKHPVRGYISPVEFIPVAEELGLIFDIGQWTLMTACKQMRTWQEMNIDTGMMSVNVSALQFHHPSFVPSVRGALAFSGIPPERLMLEITESTLATSFLQVSRMLMLLRGFGVRISIDDFGTGYSSLSYLRKLPIDELKIDRSFLEDVESNSDSAAIVRAILALARSLDLKVIAEGVETEAQLDFLTAHACTAFQGFLRARPMPAAELLQHLGVDTMHPAA